MKARWYALCWAVVLIVLGKFIHYLPYYAIIPWVEVLLLFPGIVCAFRDGRAHIAKGQPYGWDLLFICLATFLFLFCFCVFPYLGGKVMEQWTILEYYQDFRETMAIQQTVGVDND